MRQADTAAHGEKGVGVTARYHNFILPLPASYSQSQRQMHKHLMQAYMHINIRAVHIETHRTELKVVPVHCFSM